MRHRLSVRRAATTIPAALAGSLALSLTAAPAHAAGHTDHRVAQPSPPLTVAQRAALAQATAGVSASMTTPAARVDVGAATPSARPATTASAPTATAHTAPAAATPRTYRVVRGDTVSAIAARFGLRTTDVLSWNHLGWSTIIRPGQTLSLHSGSAPAATTAHAKKAGNTSRSTSAQKVTVRAGDTVTAIAARAGTSINAVLEANGLKRSSIIYPGQTLIVHGGGGAVASTPQAQPAEDKAAPSAPAPSGAVEHITVRPGDTVSAIAAGHHTSVAAVLAANHLQMSSIIYPGQKLAVPTDVVPGLTAEQSDNARLIVRIGRQLGVPDRGIAIALGTAMQESGLRNLSYGDRDSLGLFQQRPSQGWGSKAEVTDPARSTRAFFGGAGDPNGKRTDGLLDVSGWQRMSFADAAQAVQISAFPHLYAQWEKPAHRWLKAIG